MSEGDRPPRRREAHQGHEPTRRTVRSFVRRAGRLTTAQARALHTLGPRFVIADGDSLLQPDAVFGRSGAPRVLEIGFGDGEALAATAARHPEADFLGIEVHTPGVGHLLLQIERAGLENVRILYADAVRAITRLPAGSIDVVNVFFPDPWPKKRHHKRRLIQLPFVAMLARLQPGGGLLHVATDWTPYAEHIVEVLDAAPDYARCDADAVADRALAWRPQTRFERRGLKRGHRVTDIHARRQ